MAFQLVIKSYADKDYRHVISTAPNKKSLARVEIGANINLNHDEYFTDIEEVVDEDPQR